jgi:hypothetical protein
VRMLPPCNVRSLLGRSKSDKRQRDSREIRLSGGTSPYEARSKADVDPCSQLRGVPGAVGVGVRADSRFVRRFRQLPERRQTGEIKCWIEGSRMRKGASRLVELARSGFAQPTQRDGTCSPLIGGKVLVAGPLEERMRGLSFTGATGAPGSRIRKDQLPDILLSRRKRRSSLKGDRQSIDEPNPSALHFVETSVGE